MSQSTSASTQSSSTSSSLPIRLALVGCGQIVTHHLTAMAKVLPHNLQVTALCDPSVQRRQVIWEWAQTKGLAVSNDDNDTVVVQCNTLEELVKQHPTALERVDVIFGALPHDLHEHFCLQAVKTGKVVVMEKPLAPTREACNQLVAVSHELYHKKTGAMLVVAEQSPYWQEVVRAKEAIAAGQIGTVVTAAAYYYESMRDNVTSGSVDGATGHLGWRGSLARAGGGIALDGGLHWIRPLREMLGSRIEQVVGVTRRHLAPALGMEGESLGHALFQMASSPASSGGPLEQPVGSGPLIATYSCNMLATAPMAHDTCPYFRITGEGGELVIHGDGLLRHPGAGGLRLYNEENASGIEFFPADREGGFFLGFAGLWQEIYRIVTEKDYEAAHETVVRASDDVRVVLALYKSSETRQWEKT